jgi:hypothetical protein
VARPFLFRHVGELLPASSRAIWDFAVSQRLLIGARIAANAAAIIRGAAGLAAVYCGEHLPGLALRAQPDLACAAPG